MQLRDDEIHIFAAPLNTTLPSSWLDALSTDEYERAMRLQLPLHQQRFKTARAILRHLLSLYLHVDPKQLTFSYNSHRKPALAGAEVNLVQFNLSHSADMAVYAFCRNHPVGIDIELIRPENKPDIATRFFSSNEVITLAGLPPADQTAAFYHLWARKEAIIKAYGKGLAQPLSSFSVSLGDQPEQVHIEQQSWMLYPLAIDPNYAAAVAVTSPVTSLSIWDFIDQKPILRSMMNLVL